jgi:hypothetical protein
MNTRTLFTLLATCSLATSFGCGAPPSAPEATGQDQDKLIIPLPPPPVVLVDPCLTAPSDVYTDLTPGTVIFGWAMNAPSLIVTSRSGFYGAPYNGRTCMGYVADFEVHPHSDAVWNPQLGAWVGAPISAWAGAWDLPSSGSDHTNAGDPVDAARMTTTVTLYSKNVGDPSFKQVSTYQIAGGVVKYGYVPGSDGIGFANPMEGQPDIVYRVVVSVQERTSWQEVRVLLDNPPLR